MHLKIRAAAVEPLLPTINERSKCPTNSILLDNIRKAIASNNITIEQQFSTGDNHLIIFSEHRGPENHKFVLKQVQPNTSAARKFAPVNEWLGARIADEADIPMNCVSMIPSTSDFALKPFAGYPATLHTFIVGTIPMVNKEIDGRVISLPAINILQIKGLTLDIIKNMSKSPNLAKIAAFDTFLGNSDRNYENYYMTSKGHFVGFDNEKLFHAHLASGSLGELQKLIASGVQFTPEEVAGLRIYRDTLAQLINQFSLPTIYTYMDEGIEMSGLPKLPIVNPEFPNFNPDQVAVYKNLEKYNIEASKSLLAFLNDLLSRY